MERRRPIIIILLLDDVFLSPDPLKSISVYIYINILIDVPFHLMSAILLLLQLLQRFDALRLNAPLSHAPAIKKL